MRTSSVARLSALLLIATALAGFAGAQEAAPEAKTPAELQRIQDEIARTSGQREADEAERAKLAAELEDLQAESAVIAAEVQRLERDLTRAEARIAELSARDTELTTALEQRRARIGPLLGALQRLRRDPPPALAVSPDDAVAAARGAMLIAAVAEKLEAEATELSADLTALARNRMALTAERDAAKTRNDEIAHRRTELAGLIERRQQTVAVLSEGVAGADAHIAALEARAADMTDLMAWLEEGESATASSADAASAPVTVASRKTKTSFASAKGHVPWPAAGVVAGRFGEPGIEGAAALGLTIRTRAEAQVTAPADGEIVFAGPFEGYGRLLILSPGEDYFIVIGGFGRLDATVGQHVLAGEPLGTMAGTQAAGEALMYIELRRKGAPIDPLPWLVPLDANG
ncbi:Chromosome partition protein Smc [Alphaproteobacteria bacterium SO-S41]|nr:Chromosome partition protein Smc [Alphaproteobacteria bacterium SO-S41]